MKNIMKNTAILTAITLSAGFFLGVVYEITKEPIRIAKEARANEAYKAVFPEAESFSTYENYSLESAAEILKAASFNNSSITGAFVAKNGETELGHVLVVVAHDGYSGDLSFAMGVTSDGILNGISLLEIAETPGLGMNAAEPEFLEKFTNKSAEEFKVTKTGSTNEHEIDALSGATITTNAIVNSLNAGLIYLDDIAGGKNNE